MADMRRTSSIVAFACIAWLADATHCMAAETWTLQNEDGPNGKTCSLSTIDRGRALSFSLSTSSTDQGVIRISFEDPELVQPGTKTLATLEFDNGTRERHRLEASSDGPLLIPIVASNMDDALQSLSASRTLKITTRYGSTSFTLDGIADHMPALRHCADS
jgi:hypothetical protein